DWMGAYPTSITAKLTNLAPHLYDTEDNLSAVLMFPQGFVQVHLSWSASVRKVIYTIHGENGAIFVNDDEIQLSLVNQLLSRQIISSQWEDPSHVQWFNPMFDQFIRAMEAKDYVNQEAYEALLCIQTIEAAHRSHREGSREVHLGKLAVTLEASKY